MYSYHTPSFRWVLLTLLFLLTNNVLADESVLFMTAPTDQGPFEIQSATLPSNSQSAPTKFTKIGLGAYPNISSDGKTVAFIEGEHGQYQIVTMDMNGANKRIWSGRGMNFHPDFSGNGRYLAYSAAIEKVAPDPNDPPIMRNQIMVIDTQNSDAQPEMIETEADAFFPKLSSDGRLVVFHISKKEDREAKRAKWKGVVAYDRLKKKLTPLTGEDQYCHEPALSFDDQMVAMSCYTKWPLTSEESDDDIFVMNLADPTATYIRITQNPAHDLYANFRPNGDIVFSSNRNGNYQLFLASKNLEDPEVYDVRPWVNVGEGLLHYSVSFSGNQALQLRHHEKAFQEGRSSFGLAQDQQQLYVMGGQVLGQHEHDQEAIGNGFETFSPNNPSPKSLPPRPHSAEGFGTASYAHKIYAFGGLAPAAEGEAGPHSIDAIDVYDTETNQWQTLPVRLKDPRSSFTAVQIDNKVFILGGWHYTPEFAAEHDDEGRYLETIEVFDLINHTLNTSHLTLAQPLRRAFAATNYGGLIIIAGGMSGGSRGFLDTVTLFNPFADDMGSAWMDMSPLPLRSFAPAASVIGENLYVSGGYSVYFWADDHSRPPQVRLSNHIFSLNLVDAYQPWQHTGRFMQEGRAFHTAATDKKNRTIYFVGGQAASGAAPQSVSASMDTVTQAR